jgi:hypothetical protein
MRETVLDLGYTSLTVAFLTHELKLFPFEALKEAVRQIQKPEIAEMNSELLANFEGD